MHPSRCHPQIPSSDQAMTPSSESDVCSHDSVPFPEAAYECARPVGDAVLRSCGFALEVGGSCHGGPACCEAREDMVRRLCRG